MTPVAAAAVVVVELPAVAEYTVVATPLDRLGDVGAKVPPRVDEKVTPVTKSLIGFPCPSLAETIRVVLPPSGRELLLVVRLRLYPIPFRSRWRTKYWRYSPVRRKRRLLLS